MRIEVDVIRADQSWDLSTGIQQNFLVVNILGIEVRAPCSEEQLVAVLAEITAPGGGEDEEEPPLDETEERKAPPVFQPVEASLEGGPKLQAAPQRQLKPLKRGDDAGIAQG